jgi:excisionase family DNA binding protein
MIENKILTSTEVAEYLRLDVDTVKRLASQGKIPAVKLGKKWRFRTDYVESWLETEMVRGFSGNLDLTEIEEETSPVLIHSLIPEGCIDLSLKSKNKYDILAELVNLAEQSDFVDNRRKLIFSLLEREHLCSTGLANGLAIPHPRFRQKGVIKKPFIVFGRSDAGVDFDALDGNPTYIFFLICLRFDQLHVKIMARLSRLLKDSSFPTKLKEAKHEDEVINIIQDAEHELLNL